MAIIWAQQGTAGGNCMTISPLCAVSQKAKSRKEAVLVDGGVARLEREYFAAPDPDMSDPNQRVSFGTSGHRGSPLRGTFTESHIVAITQAICDYRRGQDVDGPLYMGKDTHALSGPAANDTHWRSSRPTASRRSSSATTA